MITLAQKLLECGRTRSYTHYTCSLNVPKSLDLPRKPRKVTKQQSNKVNKRRKVRKTTADHQGKSK